MDNNDITKSSLDNCQDKRLSVKCVCWAYVLLDGTQMGLKKYNMIQFYTEISTRH